jgi:outer membrane lipoprotein-sorting protein
MRPRLLHLVVTFFVLLLCAPFSSGKTAEKTEKSGVGSPDKILDKLQKSWDGTNTYEAAFHQTVYSKRLGTRDESSGTLYVVKPSKLRWESKTDGSVQIMNTSQLIVITKNKRRGTTVVDMYHDLAKVMDSKPLAFLSGKSKFRDIYRVELLAETPQLAEMRFTPKTDAAETLVAEIDKESYLLRSLTSETVDSRVRTEFSGTKINVKLDDKLFEYKPNATDIIHNN